MPPPSNRTSCADLIGKTLVDKTSVAVQLVVTHTQDALDLRQRLEVPVVWLAATEATWAAGTDNCVQPAEGGRAAILVHPRFPQDVAVVREMLAALEGIVDLTEPFAHPGGHSRGAENGCGEPGRLSSWDRHCWASRKRERPELRNSGRSRSQLARVKTRQTFCLPDRRRAATIRK